MSLPPSGSARSPGRAAAAAGRLGEAAARAAGSRARREPTTPRSASLIRAAAAAAVDHGFWIVEPALRDPDRVVVLAALESLGAAGGSGLLDADDLRGFLTDAAALASRAAAARTALADVDDSLVRALDDEIDLARRLVIAVLALRYGERVRAAVRVIDHGEGATARTRSRGSRRAAVPRRGCDRPSTREARRKLRSARVRTEGSTAAGEQAGGVDRRHCRRSGRPMALAVAHRVRPACGRAVNRRRSGSPPAPRRIASRHGRPLRALRAQPRLGGGDGRS